MQTAVAPTSSATQTIPIVLNLVAAVFGAVGQYAYKRGAAQLSIVPVFKNVSLLLGVVAFCLVMGLFVVAFKLGGRLSVVYPMYATTFLWGTLIGIVVDREPWSAVQLAGALVTIAGISLVAWGASGAR